MKVLAILILTSLFALSLIAEETNNLKTATFGGGCFWCLEPPFDKIEGVVATRSGYAGGSVESPSYEQVSAGSTGHAEVVQVVYDPTKVTYQELLDIFWVNIDPTVKDQQFCDRGSQYRSAIFYEDDEQKKLAEASKQKLVDSGRFSDVYTEIVPLDVFWPAEDYHQNYYQKNPLRYKFYRFTCGRDQRLKELWGDQAKK